MVALRSDWEAASLPPSTTAYLACKEAAEWIVSLILLILAAPLIGLIALLVRLASPGPAFYHQVRLGKGGQPFMIHKMRTMTHNCEAATGAVWATPRDPRITPLGRFLRDTHFDELPQLWNVLRGQMSLIGPRPERPEIAAQLDEALPGYCTRLKVRPGLTGLAQVRLPADLDLDGARQKLAHDLLYIRKLNFILDFRIAVATIFVCLTPVVSSMVKVLGRAYRPGVGAALRRRVRSGLEGAQASTPVIYREILASAPLGPKQFADQLTLKMTVGALGAHETPRLKRPLADTLPWPRRGADVEEVLQQDWAQAA
jgi:lipopolysaccharide/colanic/teichoic acid biosynthesis glycosyltransferase